MTNDLTIILTENNNQPVANSRQIAEHFGKEHRNVLRDVENLKKDMLNFEQMFFETTMPDSYGREQRVYLMNRDGFTLLAMGFNGKKALQFKLAYINAFNEMEKKLKEVLPSYAIEDPIKRAQAWIAEQEKLKELETEIQVKQQLLSEYQPKIEYTDAILSSPDTVNITQIAKDYGMSGQALNRVLNLLGVQFNQRGQWLLYAKHQEKGYTQSSTIMTDGGKTVLSTKWTQKGRLFIHNLLEQNGFYANIEAPEGYDAKKALEEFFMSQE